MWEDTTVARERFTGTIAMNEERFPVGFEVWSGEDLRLMVDLQPLTTNAAFALQRAMGKPGSIDPRGARDNGLGR